ncbi:MAG: hypothetical protein CM1200mP10_09090 [Candidatus Neomarinimicrobiota bacterium]|nr:MAG: hypothetical protein CM1200mP10_09090 [Candidatus Neomarinimicrobiota bacterium]
MFGIIPKTLWEKEAPADEYNRIQMVTRSLLVVSNERKIIIDTGNGINGMIRTDPDTILIWIK